MPNMSGGARGQFAEMRIPRRRGRSLALGRWAGYDRRVPSVGSQLSAARERLQLSVRDVANATNIKSDHIRAMEAGDWGVFSAPVYVKGFVRTYAQHLKMDVPAVLRELDADLLRVRRDPETDPLTLGSARGPLDFAMLQFSRVPWAWVFPLGLGVAVVVAAVYGVRAWKSREHVDPLTRLGSPLHDGRIPSSAAALMLPTNAPAAGR